MQCKINCHNRCSHVHTCIQVHTLTSRDGLHDTGVRAFEPRGESHLVGQAALSCYPHGNTWPSLSSLDGITFSTRTPQSSHSPIFPLSGILRVCPLFHKGAFLSHTQDLLYLYILCHLVLNCSLQVTRPPQDAVFNHHHSTVHSFTLPRYDKVTIQTF